MNFARISKALAGGIAGAVTGGTAVTVHVASAAPDANLITVALTALGGFIVGFLGVYLAPANKAS